jgi:hypothetical protein
LQRFREAGAKHQRQSRLSRSDQHCEGRQPGDDEEQPDHNVAIPQTGLLTCRRLNVGAGGWCNRLESHSASVLAAVRAWSVERAARGPGAARSIAPRCGGLELVQTRPRNVASRPHRPCAGERRGRATLRRRCRAANPVGGRWNRHCKNHHFTRLAAAWAPRRRGFRRCVVSTVASAPELAGHTTPAPVLAGCSDVPSRLRTG